MNSFREILIKNIKDLGETVAISGVIIFVDDDYFLIDDCTGQARILSKSNLNIGSYTRIFGIVVSTENLEINPQIVQDLSTIDKKLHKRLKELLE